jgi:coenzyme F420-reducing hydrogenase gamma subunit
MPEARKPDVLTRMQPVLGRMTSGRLPCEARGEAAHFYLAADHDAEAADQFVTAARSCSDVSAAISAEWPLKKLGRCSDAVRVLAEVYPASKQEQRVPLFDAVTDCSNSVTIRKNLSFAPPDEVQGYFDLLEQRRREEERRRREQQLREMQERIRRENEERAWACQNDCDRGVSQCQSGCAGDGACMNFCASNGSMCRSGCH